MQCEPISDPCSFFDQGLAKIERALGEYIVREAKETQGVPLSRLVRELVTELRVQEKERVRRILGQI